MIDWNAAPIVGTFRATCPNCFSERYVPIRGWRSNDGSRTSRRVCQDCSTPYINVSEPILPDSGKAENEVDIFPPSTRKEDFQ